MLYLSLTLLQLYVHSEPQPQHTLWQVAGAAGTAVLVEELRLANEQCAAKQAEVSLKEGRVQCG